ncbi:MAG: phytanoyl-CoA dioxygenase family protein [Candidatus Poribacteria bacterium]|nr:phytanoyl-CoA dioxygenase family protein [Candidatus Poribacteria bacterium]
MRLSEQETYGCEPTLTDRQVLEFCKNGYMVLEGVVPDEINRRTIAYCDEHPGIEPSGILKEDWFIENVIVNPAAAGAVRSLLGADFHLPVLMSNHRVTCPIQDVGGWHVDGNYHYTPELNFLQVFYYPQDTPIEMGPTQVLPGSHLIRNRARFMAHLGNIRGAIPTTTRAGSIFLTIYHIWHRRGPSTASALRNLLKYFYWRMTPPKRDWVIEPDFDFATAPYAGPAGGYVEQFRDAVKVAEMFLWLCGRHESFQNLGGQSWPLPADRNDVPYGFPAGLPQPASVDL